jgi:hypothetical protein
MSRITIDSLIARFCQVSASVPSYAGPDDCYRAFATRYDPDKMLAKFYDCIIRWFEWEIHDHIMKNLGTPVIKYGEFNYIYFPDCTL